MVIVKANAKARVDSASAISVAFAGLWRAQMIVAVGLLLLAAGCTKKKPALSHKNCEQHQGVISHGGCLCVDKLFDSEKFRCEQKQTFTGNCSVKVATYKPNGKCRRDYDTFEGIVPDSGTCPGTVVCVPLSPKRTISNAAATKCFHPPPKTRKIKGKCLEFKAVLHKL